MKNKMKNPILSGFYPDPSICRVDEDFYLVCSSFELCPGVPVFHSKDLVHWEQIGHAVTPENGLHVEKNSGNGGIRTYESLILEAHSLRKSPCPTLDS